MDRLNSHIKAVVFDFGGVLMDWDARYLYRKLFNGDEAAMEAFLTEIDFAGWNIEQDRGRSFADAIALLTAKFPHHSDLIKAYDLRWEESLVGSIQGTVDILQALKEAHYPLYALSNWSAETFYRINTQYEFLTWFDAIVLSGELKLIKPDPAIFHALLQKIGRPAAECLFIDDSATNINAAKQLGFQTIRFESPAHLASELDRLNVLPQMGRS